MCLVGEWRKNGLKMVFKLEYHSCNWIIIAMGLESGLRVPLFVVFMVIYPNLTLCGSYNSKPREPENSPKVLDDPF